MIVAVSDVHLGQPESNHDAFIRFLDLVDTEQVDHLVLLGDIFDFWRRDLVEVVEENAAIVERLGELAVKHIQYVIGNHDYCIKSFFDKFREDYAFPVAKTLRLKDKERWFFFTHGYEFDVMVNMRPMKIELYEGFSSQMCYAGNVVGGIAGNLWEIATSSPKTTMKRRPADRIGLDKLYQYAVSPGSILFRGSHVGDGLVFGHTHRPFINKARTVANTGAWVPDSQSKESNWYVKIENDSMELKRFTGSKTL
jgi:UDP-2,3-diacylglucosamine pyrophosphatase LpxH